MHFIASFSKSYKVFHRKQSNLCYVSSRNIPPGNLKVITMTSNNGEVVDDSDDVDNNGEVCKHQE